MEVNLKREVKDLMISSWLPSLNMADSIISPAGSTTQDTLTVVKE